MITGQRSAYAACPPHTAHATQAQLDKVRSSTPLYADLRVIMTNGNNAHSFINNNLGSPPA